jgi:hypothetical protein
MYVGLQVDAVRAGAGTVLVVLEGSNGQPWYDYSRSDLIRCKYDRRIIDSEVSRNMNVVETHVMCRKKDWESSKDVMRFTTHLRLRTRGNPVKQARVMNPL